jgi:hypothetical protein
MIEAFAIVWLAATPVAADAVPSPSTCLQFEPTEEAITGILIQKTLPGPPNYEDLANGDRPDTSLFIRLATPICVAATPTSELNSQNIAGIGLVQLVVPAATFSKYQRLVGQRVTAVGTLSTPHTGHQRAAVLLTVSRMSEAP